MTINKLEIPIPICLTCEVCLDEFSLSYHRHENHKIDYSDCLHPFIKGLSPKLSSWFWCICECDDCIQNHQRKPSP